MSNGNAIGGTPPIPAAAVGPGRSGEDTDTVRAVIEPNLTAVDKNGLTALHRAARTGHLDTVALLIDSKAKISAKARGSWDDATPLLMACQQGHNHVVEYLLSINPKLANERGDKKGNHPLHIAARFGRKSVCDTLLQCGCDVNQGNQYGETALMEAADNGNASLVRFLLSKGAAWDKMSQRGTNAIMKAASGAHMNVMHVMLEFILPSEYDAQCQQQLSTLLMKHEGVISKSLIAVAEDPTSGDNALLARALFLMGTSTNRLGVALNTAKKDGKVNVIENLLRFILPIHSPLFDHDIKRLTDEIMRNNDNDILMKTLVAVAEVSKDEDISTAGSSTSLAQALLFLGASLEKALATAQMDGKMRAVSFLSNLPSAIATVNDVELTEEERRMEELKTLQEYVEGAKENGVPVEWNRGRVMFIGEGRMGKTSLMDCFLGHPFQESTESTRGARIMTSMGWEKVDKPKRQAERELAKLYRSPVKCTPETVDITATMNSFASSSISADDQAEPPLRIEGLDDMRVSESQVHSVGGQLASVYHSSPSPSSFSGTNKKEPVTSIEDASRILELRGSVLTESKMLISLLDFAGQEVFNVIHHLFLTRSGVYVLVFNMQCLHPGADPKTQQESLDHMRFWLNSVAAHTFDKITYKTAPVFIVGTHKDSEEVSSPEVHAGISSLLKCTFQENLKNVWQHVVQNEEESFCFYPVSNLQGRGIDPVVKQLMQDIESALDEQPFTHSFVPLKWYEVWDEMTKLECNHLTLREVMVMAARLSVTDVQEVEHMLKLFHEMGVLLWNNEPKLRDVVILDPVKYIIDPATMVICDLPKDHYDRALHKQPEHLACLNNHAYEWQELVKKGILKRDVLNTLWSRFEEQKDHRIALMCKLGLFVPLKSSSSHEYVVPALFPKLEVVGSRSNIKGEHSNWTSVRDIPVYTCILVLTMDSSLCKSALNRAELIKRAFLPSGLFERLVGKAVGLCQDRFAGEVLCNIHLFRGIAVLSFGNQRFRIISCQELNCIRVDVEGKATQTIIRRLESLVKESIQECMGCLTCFPALLYDKTDNPKFNILTSMAESYTHCILPLELVQNAAKNCVSITSSEGVLMCSVHEVEDWYKPWISALDGSLESNCDCFISHSTNVEHDSKVAECLHDQLTEYTIDREHYRPIDVSLSSKGLPVGRCVKVLSIVKIFLPVCSTAALFKWQSHDDTQVDYLLLEWVLALFMQENRGTIIYPLFFGSRYPLSIKEKSYSAYQHGYGIRNINDDTIQISTSVPKATLRLAEQLLKPLGLCLPSDFHERTVNDIVDRFKLLDGFDASRNADGVLLKKLDRLLNSRVPFVREIVAQQPAIAPVHPVSVSASVIPQSGQNPDPRAYALSLLQKEEFFKSKADFADVQKFCSTRGITEVDDFDFLSGAKKFWLADKLIGVKRIRFLLAVGLEVPQDESSPIEASRPSSLPASKPQLKKILYYPVRKTSSTTLSGSDLEVEIEAKVIRTKTDAYQPVYEFSYQPHPTVEDFIAFTVSPDPSVGILHFAGHAQAEEEAFLWHYMPAPSEDQDAITQYQYQDIEKRTFIQQIEEALRSVHCNITLIFLNACGLSDLALEISRRCSSFKSDLYVIAWSGSVDDKISTRFSDLFYGRFISSNSRGNYEEAFKIALKATYEYCRNRTDCSPPELFHNGVSLFIDDSSFVWYDTFINDTSDIACDPLKAHRNFRPLKTPKDYLEFGQLSGSMELEVLKRLGLDIKELFAVSDVTLPKNATNEVGESFKYITGRGFVTAEFLANYWGVFVEYDEMWRVCIDHNRVDGYGIVHKRCCELLESSNELIVTNIKFLIDSIAFIRAKDLQMPIYDKPGASAKQRKKWNAYHAHDYMLDLFYKLSETLANRLALPAGSRCSAAFFQGTLKPIIDAIKEAKQQVEPNIQSFQREKIQSLIKQLEELGPA